MLMISKGRVQDPSPTHALPTLLLVAGLYRTEQISNSSIAVSGPQGRQTSTRGNSQDEPKF
jgi:hypothetical protein